jgi:hypothetical protein
MNLQLSRQAAVENVEKSERFVFFCACVGQCSMTADQPSVVVGMRAQGVGLFV